MRKINAIGKGLVRLLSCSVCGICLGSCLGLLLVSYGRKDVPNGLITSMRDTGSFHIIQLHMSVYLLHQLSHACRLFFVNGHRGVLHGWSRDREWYLIGISQRIIFKDPYDLQGNKPTGFKTQPPSLIHNRLRGILDVHKSFIIPFFFTNLQSCSLVGEFLGLSSI